MRSAPKDACTSARAAERSGQASGQLSLKPCTRRAATCWIIPLSSGWRSIICIVPAALKGKRLAIALYHYTKSQARKIYFIDTLQRLLRHSCLFGCFLLHRLWLGRCPLDHLALLALEVHIMVGHL